MECVCILFDRYLPWHVLLLLKDRWQRENGQLLSLTCSYDCIHLLHYHPVHLSSLLLYTEIATLGASVFSRSRINRLQIDISRGFAIPRLYDTHCQFCCHIEHTYLCVCICLLCICDILWHTSTFPRHGLDQYSFQDFSHRLLLWWMMSSSPSLQDENLYWRPGSILCPHGKPHS